MNIFVVQEKDVGGPQELAMLQALYSRSVESVQVHLEKVRKNGSAKFMESNYVGYGHDSIADCGNVAVFVEGVSIIAVKAIQDNPLFNGQETSTRYIDFSTREFYDPLENKALSSLLDEMRQFYSSTMPQEIEYNKERFPKQDDVADTIYANAIKAKSFDVLRGFLPCGALTQTSWYGSLRQMNDRLQILNCHPLEEVRKIASSIRLSLAILYPSSIKQFKEDEETKEYLSGIDFHYLFPTVTWNSMFGERQGSSTEIVNARWGKYLYSRPKRMPLPRQIGLECSYRFDGKMDYGSFRDLQRHRNGICPIPMVVGNNGFEKWYTDNLSPDNQARGREILRKSWEILAAARENYRHVDLQYYWPLSTIVPFSLRYDLPQCVYVVELRTPKFVHPTARKVARGIHDIVSADFPDMKFYADLDESDWDIRRGKQTITEKLQ